MDKKGTGAIKQRLLYNENCKPDWSHFLLVFPQVPIL